VASCGQTRLKRTSPARLAGEGNELGQGRLSHEEHTGSHQQGLTPRTEVTALADEDHSTPAKPGASATPVVLRVVWCALLLANAVFVAAVIAGAWLLGRRAICLSATGPLLIVGALSLLAWWRTRRPDRPSLLGVLWWATVALDAVVITHTSATLYWFGSSAALLFLLCPLAPAALLTLFVWWQTRGPGRNYWLWAASSSPRSGRG
jgi:hypothetical protein